MNKRQRERLLKVIDEADRLGVSQSELILALSPIYGKSNVSVLIRTARDRRTG